MTQGADAALDPLSSGALHAELPGTATAFDAGAMRSHLHAALIGPRGPAKVQRCTPDEAILLDGPVVVVRYRLEVEDAAGRLRPALVTGRLFPAAARATEAASRLAPLAAGARGRAEVAPFAAPVAVIEPLAMLVHAFPIDPELPTLIAATDPTTATAVLGELLGGRVRVDGCRAEPAHYNRRHRCMLRFHLDVAGGRELTLYGKVANDGSGAHTPAVVDALRGTLAGAGVAVPECLGFRADLQLVVFTAIPGVPRVAQLLKARLRDQPPPPGGPALEAAVETCAQIAAALHTGGLRLGPPRPLHAELARLRGQLVPIRRLSAALGGRLGDRLDLVEATAAATPALEACQCHGDYSYTQLIFDGAQAGLVDFDNVGQAEPALDLGQFLAYLRYAGLRARGGGEAEPGSVTERLAERFLAAYVAAGGPAQALPRVGVYEAVSLIRMAQHAWQNLKGARLGNVLAVLDERLPPHR
jgi:hypothetical protein